MDFADATFVRASELFPTSRIVTDDSQFQWDRRHRDEKLPVPRVPQ